MKSRRFVWSPIFIVMLLSMLLIPNSLSQTVIGKSSFPAEEDDAYIWRCVNSTGPKHNINDLTKFTVESIYNETFDSVHSLMVNYSVDSYDVIKGQWIRKQDNLFYLAYNETERFLNWSAIAYQRANIYIVPTPLNLTMIGEAVKSAGILDYLIDDDVIRFDYGNGTTIEVKINSQGISTVIESFNLTETVYRWELNEDDIIIIIPMGNYFIIYSIISFILVLVLFKKKIEIKN